MFSGAKASCLSGGGGLTGKKGGNAVPADDPGLKAKVCGRHFGKHFGVKSLVAASATRPRGPPTPQVPCPHQAEPQAGAGRRLADGVVEALAARDDAVVPLLDAVAEAQPGLLRQRPQRHGLHLQDAVLRVVRVIQDLGRERCARLPVETGGGGMEPQKGLSACQQTARTVPSPPPPW